MAQKAEKLILDTNLWISFLIKKDFKKLDRKIKTGEVKLIFSTDLLEEFITVASRPKFKKYFEKKDVSLLLELFDVYGEIIHVKSKVDICRDPKDNFLLSLSKDSKADYLITADNDLLVIKEFEETKIVTMQGYLNMK
jgi:uncharacterized protein